MPHTNLLSVLSFCWHAPIPAIFALIFGLSDHDKMVGCGWGALIIEMSDHDKMAGRGRDALIGRRGSSQQGSGLGTRFAHDSSWEEMHSRGGETELGRGGDWETGGGAEREDGRSLQFRGGDHEQRVQMHQDLGFKNDYEVDCMDEQERIPKCGQGHGLCGGGGGRASPRPKRNPNGKNFNPDEESQLVRSVLVVSQDPVCGNQ